MILDYFACKPTPAPLHPRYRCWHHLPPPAGTCLLMKYNCTEEGNSGSVKYQPECQHTIAGWCSHPWLFFRRIRGMSLLFVLHFVADTYRVTFCLLPAGFCAVQVAVAGHVSNRAEHLWEISNYFLNVCLQKGMTFWRGSLPSKNENPFKSLPTLVFKSLAQLTQQVERPASCLDWQFWIASSNHETSEWEVLREAGLGSYMLSQAQPSCDTAPINQYWNIIFF